MRKARASKLTSKESTAKKSAFAAGRARTLQFSSELLGEEFVYLAQKVPAIIFVCVQDRIVFANDAATRALGYGMEELYHPRFTFPGIVADADRHSVVRILAECLDRNKDVNSLEVRLVSKSGAKLDCVMSAKQTSFNHAKAILCVLTDITALKRATQALRETGTRYQELFNNAPIGIYRTTPSGRVVVANPAIVKLLGYSSFDELSKVDVETRCHPDVPRKVFIDQIEEHGEIRGFESKWFRKDGSVLNVRENARVIRDETGKTLYYEGTVEDITEHRSIQEDFFQRREFDRLITNIATGFVNMDVETVDEAINEALKQLGEFMNADRGYVFLFGRNKTTFDNTHEWCNAGIEPHIQELKNLQIKDFEWSNSRILQREVVYIPRVRDLPLDAAVEKREFTRENIQSLVLVPLLCGTSVLGFLGFDSVRSERSWDDDTIALFKLVAEIFASAIERKRASDEMRTRLEFEKLVTTVSAGFVNMEPARINEAITDALGSIGRFLGLDCASVFCTVNDGQDMLRRYGWNSEPCFGPVKVGELISRNILPFDREHLDKSGVVCCYQAADPRWNQPAFSLLKGKGVRSWLAIPFAAGRDSLWLCLSSIKKEIEWNSDSVALVKILAEIIARALDLQKASEKLVQERRLMNALMDNIPDSIYFKDEKSRFIRVNKALSDHHEFQSVKDAIGKTDFDSFTNEVAQQLFAEEQAIMRTGKPIIAREQHLTRKNGHAKWVSTTKLPLYDEKGRIVGTFGVSRDITERKRAEEENRKLHAQMQHAQKLESLGVLSGGIAHDFNNLLMGILGHTGLALMELPPDSAAWTHLKQVETVALRATELTNQMLAYSGKSTFVVKPINLSKLVREMGTLLEVSISSKVKLDFKCPDDIPAIEGDPAQIRQVVMNLITNASDAIGDMKGAISLITGVADLDSHYLATCYLGDKLPSGKYVFAEVVDTGCGMDASVRDRIFDPFFTTKVKGRGLGLAAVLGIVRGHRGTIKVYSEVGKGTDFRVLFPASEKAAVIEPAAKTTKPRMSFSGSVMVIDDDEVVRAVTTQILKKLGFVPKIASDLNDAMKECESITDLKVIMLDVSLPEIGVEAALAEVKKRFSCVPILLVSGYNEQTATVNLRVGSFEGFLQKPFSAEALVDKLQEVLLKSM